jgi:aminoglycoside phosphotransferase (APT) family kinase protein
VSAIHNVLARIIRLGRSIVPTANDDASHAHLATSLVDDLARRLGKPCELVDFRGTRTGSLTVRVRADRPYVAKLPLRASTEPRLRQNAKTLGALGEARWITPFLSDRCPAVILLGTVSGHFYSVETTIPGQDGASILKAGGSPEEMVLSAERFLSKLHKASVDTAIAGPGRWEDSFESAIQRVERLATQADCRQAYGELICAIRNDLSAQPIPSVYAHGNFWLGNALFDRASNLTGVIDWDCASEHALPALDLIYLLVRTHSMARAVSFGEAMADWIEADSLPFLDDCIVRHCHELSIRPELIYALSYCAWIDHLDAHCRFETSTSTNPRWLDLNVGQVLKRWQLSTTTGHRSVGRWSVGGA